MIGNVDGMTILASMFSTTLNQGHSYDFMQLIKPATKHMHVFGIPWTKKAVDQCGECSDNHKDGGK